MGLSTNTSTVAPISLDVPTIGDGMLLISLIRDGIVVVMVTKGGTKSKSAIWLSAFPTNVMVALEVIVQTSLPSPKNGVPATKIVPSLLTPSASSSILSVRVLDVRTLPLMGSIVCNTAPAG